MIEEILRLFGLRLEMLGPILWAFLLCLTAYWLSVLVALAITKERFEIDFRTRIDLMLGKGVNIKAVTVSPIWEEVIFRGPIYSLFDEFSVMSWTAIIVSAVIFGILHSRFKKENIVWAIYSSLFGIALGWLTVNTGSLAPTIIVHAALNLHYYLTVPALIKRGLVFFISLIP